MADTTTTTATTSSCTASRSRQQPMMSRMMILLLLVVVSSVSGVEGYTNTILFPASENDYDDYDDVGRGHGHVGHRRTTQDPMDPQQNPNQSASSKYAYYRAQEKNKNNLKNHQNGGDSSSSSSGPSVVDTTTGTTTSSRNNNQNYHKKLKNRKNPEGAPSRYLEYEGPDATYLIRLGKHPTISYPNLKDFTDTEIRIVYNLSLIHI